MRNYRMLFRFKEPNEAEAFATAVITQHLGFYARGFVTVGREHRAVVHYHYREHWDRYCIKELAAKHGGEFIGLWPPEPTPT